MNVNKDQGNKDVDGSLLCPPEAEFEAKKRNLIQFLDQQNPKTEWHGEPNTEQNTEQAQIGFPVAIVVVVHENSPLSPSPDTAPSGSGNTGLASTRPTL